eukprot:scaffold61181_cov19-Prasinocladus_malaysianus.AAC.1
MVIKSTDDKHRIDTETHSREGRISNNHASLFNCDWSDNQSDSQYRHTVMDARPMKGVESLGILSL